MMHKGLVYTIDDILDLRFRYIILDVLNQDYILAMIPEHHSNLDIMEQKLYALVLMLLLLK